MNNPEINPQRVQLTAEEGLAFEQATARRRAILEAADVLARQFADKVEASNAAINACYQQAGAKYSLNLARCGYEYDQDTKTLVLRAVRYD